jgi:C-terminal processing protease CtpA/Prc
MQPVDHSPRARRFRIFALLAVFSLTVAPLACGADEKGWFGFEVSVEIEGISFNPTLHAAKIAKVLPSSPAAAAGLTVGDLIVEIQSLVIPGAKARDLKTAMHKSVGESLHFKVKHGTAEPHSVTLVAIVKPEGK